MSMLQTEKGPVIKTPKKVQNLQIQTSEHNGEQLEVPSQLWLQYSQPNLTTPTNQGYLNRTRSEYVQLPSNIMNDTSLQHSSQYSVQLDKNTNVRQSNLKKQSQLHQNNGQLVKFPSNLMEDSRKSKHQVISELQVCQQAKNQIAQNQSNKQEKEQDDSQFLKPASEYQPKLSVSSYSSRQINKCNKKYPLNKPKQHMKPVEPSSCKCKIM